MALGAKISCLRLDSVMTLETQAGGGLWHNAFLPGTLGSGWQGGKEALLL